MMSLRNIVYFDLIPHSHIHHPPSSSQQHHMRSSAAEKSPQKCMLLIFTAWDMKITYLLGGCKFGLSHCVPPLVHTELWQKQHNAPSALLPLKQDNEGSASQCPHKYDQYRSCFGISALNRQEENNIVHIKHILLDYLWWPVLYRNYSAFPSVGRCWFFLWQQTTPLRSHLLTDQLEPSNEHPSCYHPVELRWFVSGVMALKRIKRKNIFKKGK